MKVCEFLENLESKTEMYFSDSVTGNELFASNNAQFCCAMVGRYAVTTWSVSVDSCLMVWIVSLEDNNE